MAVIAAQGQSGPTGWLLLGVFLVVLGQALAISFRRSTSVPKRVRRAEPGITLQEFVDRNRRLAALMTQIGLFLVVVGVLKWIVSLLASA